MIIVNTFFGCHIGCRRTTSRSAGSTEGGAPSPTPFAPHALSGLRDSRGGIVGSIPTGYPKPRNLPLLYVQDTTTDHRFLVDTGATVSVFPHNSAETCSDLKLVTADGSSIRSWGVRSIILTIGVHRFVWPFRLASFNRPILGADFLAANNILVDVARHRLLDAATLQPLTNLPTTSDPNDCTATLTTRDTYSSLLNEFPELTSRERKKPR